MGNELQAWPSEAEPLAEYILNENRKLWNGLETVQNEGIDHKYYKLVKMLLPNIIQRSEAIRDTAAEIIQLAAGMPRRGRKPKWLTTTEEAHSQAERINTAIRMAYDEARKRHWLVVAHLVSESRKSCQTIYAYMSTVPLRDSDDVIVPEIFYQ